MAHQLLLVLPWKIFSPIEACTLRDRWTGRQTP